VVDYSADLKNEIIRHFRHSSEYRHLLSDVSKVRSEALHIDKLSHHVHDLDDVRHLEADLKDLDELVHHIGDLLDDIDAGCRRGHTHGDTRHVRRLVANINRSIHSMEYTVAELRRKFTPRRIDRCENDRRYSSSIGERIAAEVIREVVRGRSHRHQQRGLETETETQPSPVG